MAQNFGAELTLKDRFTSKLKNASKRVDSFRNQTLKGQKSVGGLNSTLKNTGGIASGATKQLLAVGSAIGGMAVAYQGFKSTIGAASELESQMISMEHFMGLTRSTEEAKSAAGDYVDYLRKNANVTPFETGAVIEAGRRALQVAGGDIGQSKNMLKIAEDMVALNPGKTLSDGMEALADLAVGETERMKEFGFKISADELKEAGGAFEVMNGEIAKTFEGGAKKLSQSSAGLLSTISGSFKTGLQDMGIKALDKLKPELQKMADFMSGGGMDWIKEKGSNFLAGAVDKSISFANYIRNNCPTIKTTAIGIKDQLTPIGETIMTLLGKAKDFGGYVINNWGTIKPIVLALSAGLITLKASFMALSIINMIKTAMAAYKTTTFATTLAQKGFNAALRANPIGFVITLITLLVTAGVYLWQNWDTVKAKAGQLWSGIKDKFTKVKMVTKAVWDSVKSKIGNSMDTARTKVSNFFSPLLEFIRSAKQKWNSFKDAISNFKMPKIGMPKWLGGKGLIQGSHATGLRRVPHDGYVAELHKDEAVLPKHEAEAYRKQGFKGNNKSTSKVSNSTSNSNNSKNDISINIYAKDRSTKDVLDEFVPELEYVLANM